MGDLSSRLLAHSLTLSHDLLTRAENEDTKPDYKSS